MSLSVTVVPVTPYQQNCSIIKCETTGLAAVVDPGGDTDRIKAAIEKMGAKVEKILLTHGHTWTTALRRMSCAKSGRYPSKARRRAIGFLSLIHI